MYLCCEMRATSYTCVKLIFLHSLHSPRSTEILWIPFPSNINWDVDPEANIAVFHFSKLAEHRSPRGGCCSNADSSFKVPPEVEFYWTSDWGACQVEHTCGTSGTSVPSGTSVTLTVLPSSFSTCLRVSRNHGVQGMVGLLPSFPSWLLALPWSLCMWCLENSTAWTVLLFVFFLQVRSQALGMSSLTDIYFLQESGSWPQKCKWSNLHFSFSKEEEKGTTPCQQSHPTGNAALCVV